MYIVSPAKFVTTLQNIAKLLLRAFIEQCKIHAISSKYIKYPWLTRVL